MKKITLITLLLVVAQSVLAQTPPERGALVMGSDKGAARFNNWREPYNAIETEALRISLDDNLNGFIEGKVCDACKRIKVIITPETKAISDHIEVPLKNAKARLGKSALVTYDVRTKRVIKIRW